MSANKNSGKAIIEDWIDRCDTLRISFSDLCDHARVNRTAVYRWRHSCPGVVLLLHALMKESRATQKATMTAARAITWSRPEIGATFFLKIEMILRNTERARGVNPENNNENDIIL